MPYPCPLISDGRPRVAGLLCRDCDLDATILFEAPGDPCRTVCPLAAQRDIVSRLAIGLDAWLAGQPPPAATTATSSPPPQVTRPALLCSAELLQARACPLSPTANTTPPTSKVPMPRTRTDLCEPAPSSGLVDTLGGAPPRRARPRLAHSWHRRRRADRRGPLRLRPARRMELAAHCVVPRPRRRRSRPVPLRQELGQHPRAQSDV